MTPTGAETTDTLLSIAASVHRIEWPAFVNDLEALVRASRLHNAKKVFSMWCEESGVSAVSVISAATLGLKSWNFVINPNASPGACQDDDTLSVRRESSVAIAARRQPASSSPSRATKNRRLAPQTLSQPSPARNPPRTSLG